MAQYAITLLSTAWRLKHAFFYRSRNDVEESRGRKDILDQRRSGMHTSEIARISGVNQNKIGRILRLLAISRDVFANNRLSVLLRSTDPFYSLALDYVGDNFKWSTELAETLADPAMCHSTAPEHSAFNKYTALYAQAAPGGLEYGSRLGRAMVAWGTATEVGAIVNGFPWRDLPEGASVCDVGGGVGAVTIPLAKAFPKLLYKLQDTPDRIQQAKTEVWPQKCPEALSDNRIEFKAMNFLIEPPISGCDDLLIITTYAAEEYILQPPCPPSGEDMSHPPAPLPLLPNYGVGRVRQHNLDMDMMTGLNSQERTLGDFIRLAEAAGLSFVKLRSVGEMGIVELSKMDESL
ncbi:hypothetical protein H0H93_016263 [Arthromyces matolae]|nr:hypothetical protein H0H93_016263 [Arthromyces matolae]